VKVIGMVVMAALAVGCGTGESTSVTIGTGARGGVYYPYGVALAGILSEHVPLAQFTAEETGASVDNLRRIRAGELDMALTLADTLADAVAGRGAFAAEGPSDVRAVALLYTNYTHVIVRRNSGITSVPELAGKRVAVGAPGSGTEVIANRLLEAAGIDPNTGIDRRPIGTAEAAASLAAGEIDAMIVSGGSPTPAITTLMSRPDLELELLPHADLLPRLEAVYGPRLYRSAAIIASAYPGLTSDVAVIGVTNVLVASSRLESDLVESIIDALYRYNETLAATLPEARGLAWPANNHVAPAPFHPGAEAYYREHAWR
jgi:uncharacterized protein